MFMTVDSDILPAIAAAATDGYESPVELVSLELVLLDNIPALYYIVETPCGVSYEDYLTFDELQL